MYEYFKCPRFWLKGNQSDFPEPCETLYGTLRELPSMSPQELPSIRSCLKGLASLFIFLSCFFFFPTQNLLWLIVNTSMAFGPHPSNHFIHPSLDSFSPPQGKLAAELPLVVQAHFPLLSFLSFPFLFLIFSPLSLPLSFLRPSYTDTSLPV